MPTPEIIQQLFKRLEEHAAFFINLRSVHHAFRLKRIMSALFLATLCTVVLSSVALADIAPPQKPPGFNPVPGSETTQVRMMAETVTIDVPAVDPPRAHVTAEFTMRNLGSSTESLAVRFPIAASDGWDSFPEIRNIGIKVNDRTTAFERVQGPEPTYGFEDVSVPWAEFNVSFAPGEDVQIEVSYDLSGTGYPGETYTSFYYTLSTGAGWNGTIGSGVVILRLPYDATPQNVILIDPQNSPQFIGREAHWEFTELEPTLSDNLAFEIVKPVVWKQVAIELENIVRNPQDGEAYGRLGKAYKQALFASPKGYPRTDAAAAELYQLSAEAYDQAVTLKPEDGLWHAGYAELLLDYFYWNHFQSQDYTHDLDLGLRELDLACRLAPDEAKVKKLVEEYTYSFPDYIATRSDGSLDFISLTHTPQPRQEVTVSTSTPNPTRMANLTSRTATASLQAEPTSKPSSPLCGGAALILLPVALIAWKSRSRNQAEPRVKQEHDE